MKYFNTFLREAINAKHKQIAYHMLDEYRLLAERFVAARPELAVRISDYLCHYARAAEEQEVGFVAETVAYDLRVLNQVAYEQEWPRASDVLAAYLALAESLQSGGYRQAVAGVHKMYLGLGAFYLSKGADALAEQLRVVLRRVEPESLARLGAELLSVTEPEFWEITDRGVNFYYLEPQVRASLRELLQQLQVLA